MCVPLNLFLIFIRHLNFFFCPISVRFYVSLASDVMNLNAVKKYSLTVVCIGVTVLDLIPTLILCFQPSTRNSVSCLRNECVPS